MFEAFQAINEDFPWFFTTLAFVFGAIVGSFLNVCIYRIPAKRSIISPGSTCACGQPIKWYDNIPILSWFILRGKARCCGQSYSFRYPAIEALTGGLFALAWIKYSPVLACIYFVLIAMLICATFIDLDHMEIPDRFSLGIALLGVIFSVVYPQLHEIEAGYEPFFIYSIRGFIESITGLFIGSGVILWIAISAETILRKEAMGFGDVKLLGGIGAFVGWKAAVFSLFGGAVIGTFAILIWLLFRKKQDGEAIPEDDSKSGNAIDEAEDDYSEEEGQIVGIPVPFGPMLAGACLLYVLGLKDYVDLYFERLFEVFG